MKKIIGLILLTVLSFNILPADAQIRFGVKGGVNINSVHLNNKLLKAENTTGFNIGPMMEFMIPFAGLGLDAAILYSQKGMGLKDDKGLKKDIKNDYIDVPVNLKWKFGLPILKVYLAGGPYVNFRVGGKKIWDLPGSTVEDIKSKNFGAGLNLGAGVEVIKHLQVGFNYSLGLTEEYSSGDYNAKSRGWMFNAAILF